VKGLTEEGTPVHHFTFDQLAARIVFGAGRARTDLAGEISRLGAERVLVIASTRDAERVAALVEPLGDLVAGTFTAVREHVPLPTAEAARAAAAEVRADAVLAIGGGSTVGAAKAVALTARLPVVAVPTTYAGSEVTPVWGLTENGRKTTGTDPAVLPRVVVYDPELTATLPRDLAAASGFNALAHAVEAMWAPRRNPVSTAVAEEAIGRLATGLRKDDPAELLCGAWLGASAFAVAGSGLHHKLCHVLGGTFDLPHARTHAVVLPHVLAFNAPGAPDAVARVARALGVADGVAGLRALADEHGVPRGLRALGMPEDGIEKAAALTEPAVPEDNPVPVGDGALQRLVRAAWSGEDQ
jgi:maleylacetate reductase